MGTFVKCEKCGNMSIEVIGDNELGCEVCLNDYAEREIEIDKWEGAYCGCGNKLKSDAEKRDKICRECI